MSKAEYQISKSSKTKFINIESLNHNIAQPLVDKIMIKINSQACISGRSSYYIFNICYIITFGVMLWVVVLGTIIPQIIEPILPACIFFFVYNSWACLMLCFWRPESWFERNRKRSLEKYLEQNKPDFEDQLDDFNIKIRWNIKLEHETIKSKNCQEGLQLTIKFYWISGTIRFVQEQYRNNPRKTSQVSNSKNIRKNQVGHQERQGDQISNILKSPMGMSQQGQLLPIANSNKLSTSEIGSDIDMSEVQSSVSNLDDVTNVFVKNKSKSICLLFHIYYCIWRFLFDLLLILFRKSR